MAENEMFTDVPLTQIRDFLHHPYLVKDDESMDELVESIKERGLIQPVIISVGADIQGNITRLDNLISRLPDRLEACKEKLVETEKQIENAKAEIERPFPKEQELKEKSERLAELNALLDMDHKDNEIDEGEVVEQSVRETRQKSDIVR